VNSWPVNLVTAFGRGETLALALMEQGFSVRVLDFTKALGDRFVSGAGPFPVLRKSHMDLQKLWLEECHALPRGLVFWLPEGPVELSGFMSDFYRESRADVAALNGQRARDFSQDWMRRFLHQWTSPYFEESWDGPAGAKFPWQEDLGLFPFRKENQVISFTRYRHLDHPYLTCSRLLDIRFDGPQIEKVEVDAAPVAGFGAAQWVWCLSSAETHTLNPKVAAQLFPGGVFQPEWVWLRMPATLTRGPWSDGFPEYVVAMGDVGLPWTYSNVAILRWVEKDELYIWLRVPAQGVGDGVRRASWARDVEQMLRRRLPMGEWSVDEMTWGICPHSPVFSRGSRDLSYKNWRNWDWISPEVLARLDLSARFEAESRSLTRLQGWRADMQRKQGANKGDHALHAP